jgi:hypothetical protein
MRSKLQTLFERWLGRSQVSRRLRALLSESRVTDDCGETEEPTRSLVSSYISREDLSEDQPNDVTQPDRRASDRVRDRSSLLVVGQDAEGLPFRKLATIHDVGLGGISFFLNSPLAVGQVLDLTLCSSEFGELDGSAMFSVQAKVLRSVRPSRSVQICLIATEFKGEFTALNAGFDLDAIADDLRNAVQFDEGMRQETPRELVREFEQRR